MKKIELVLWFKCDCRCAFCVVDAETARQSMTTDEAIGHLETYRAAGARDVDLGGGEPTLREDLIPLIGAARRLRYEKIGIKTNGLMLWDPDFVGRLLDAGARRFAVPVWGDGPDVHDRLCRTPGAFERLEMGVKNVLDLGGDLEVDVLLSRATAPRLSEIVQSFRAIGAKRFSVWLYCLFGSGGTLPSLMPDLEAAGRAFEEAASIKGVRLSTSQIPPCFLGKAAALYGRIKDLELEIVTPGGSFPAESSPFEAGEKIAKCAGCRLAVRCAGIRPEYLERFPALAAAGARA